jgi:superfamily II DNA or RNA helicase
MAVTQFGDLGAEREPQLEYLPSTTELCRRVQSMRAQRVLLVGCADITDVAADEVRVARPPGPIAANGLYVFRTGSRPDIMVCRGGSQPGLPVAGSQSGLPDEHPLIKARAWFDYLWDQGTPVGGAPRFAVGDYVKLGGSNQIGRVEGHVRSDGQNVYKVSIDGQILRVGEAGLTAHQIDPDDVRTWLEAKPATARDLSVGLTLTKLTNPLTDTIYSYLSSKTVYRPYQFRPVLRLLQSQHQRLLIADEVGLGKTIEAGLIWTELEARNDGMNRVLIVCPAMLVPKWRDEMRRRFDREVTELDKIGMSNLMALLQAGDDDKRMFGAVSLERLRNKKLVTDLNDLQPRFDLVIVDEAHYLRNTATRSYALGEILSEWAETLLFLSATPLNLGSDDLYNLLHLLVQEEFADKRVFPLQIEPNRYLNALAGRLLDHADNPRSLLPMLRAVRSCELGEGVARRLEYQRLEKLLDQASPLTWRDVAEAKDLLSELNTLSSVLTRTRKVDVPNPKAVREPHQIDVLWTDAEIKAYAAVHVWALRRAAETGCPPGFATQMPLRQAASCLPAMRDRVLAGDPWLLAGDPTTDDFDDFDDLDVWSDDDEAFLPTGDMTPIFEALGATDTKFERFAERLVEAQRIGTGQVLVFSFFRRTIAYLETRLRDLGYGTRSMHGGIPVPERQRIMDDFRARKFDILLTSEVGSEGLDFEFCNVIVNYDLPWNPMKVEQRIGRVDRFGQEHDKIFIFNFHVPGTIETDIFERLYQRIRVFHESIGELEPILRDEVNQLARIVLDPSLTEAQRLKKAQQIAVAMEARRKDLDDISEASNYLTGIDSLLIDGFEQDVRSRGRFVGREELRTLLVEFFADGSGAKFVEDPSTGTLTLVGDAVLAHRVSKLGRSVAGGTRRVADLVPRLQDEEPISVTFDNEEASRRSVDLISLGHPVVRAAVKHLDKVPRGLRRFGSVRVPELSGSPDRYLVVVYLARTTGLRPSLELWPMSVNIDTGEVDDDIGFHLLAAVANGSVTDGPPVRPDELLPYLGIVDDHVVDVQLQSERERRRANADLVERRIDTQVAIYDDRVSRTEETLAKVIRERRDVTLQRLHRGRINNLRQKQMDVVAKLEEGRELALTLQPVAVAVMCG